MKALTVLFLVCAFFSGLGVAASDQIPRLVSPGSDVEIAAVGDVCPTFSWTAVEGAVAYRVEVFPAEMATALFYEKVSAVVHPILVKEILGVATSWTPSSRECLDNNGSYVWFVQAIDGFGKGVWSQGRMFKIEAPTNFAAIEETLSHSLEEHGVSKEIIEDVFNEAKSSVSHQAGTASGNDLLPISVQGTEGTYNTFYGNGAGFSLTDTTAESSFFGSHAGYSNATGKYNTYLGRQAGELDTSSKNTFLGYKAGQNGGHSSTYVGYMSGQNSSGGLNVFVGSWAGNANTGNYNVGIGIHAGRNNSGLSNTFVGYMSGMSGTSGVRNCMIGNAAGSGNTSGNDNVFLGSGAGASSGSYNTYVGGSSGGGASSMYSTVIGYRARVGPETYYNTIIGSWAGDYNTTGSHNTFLGGGAGGSNTSGEHNVYLGRSAGARNTYGSSNTFIGFCAGFENISGNTNLYLGYRAGYANTTGFGNVFLGYKAGEDATVSNQLFIDNSDTSNPLIWGDFSSDTVGLMGTVGIGTKSPAYPVEVEKTGANASIVVDRTDGATNYINATDTFGNFGTVTDHPLRLVTNSLWRMRLDSDNSLSMKNGASCTSGGVWTNASSRELKENIENLTAEEAATTLNALAPVKYNYIADLGDQHVGFIAEDVPDLVATKDRKGMSPMDVVAVLTKVLQEQQKTIDALKAEVQELKTITRAKK